VTHWHPFNPWAEYAVYVPAEELAEAIAGGTVRIGLNGPTVDNDAAFILERWRRHPAIDAYILPQPEGRHSVGVRYGREGSQYYSPHNQNPEKVEELLQRYRIMEKTA
jgi:hypothetical protein